MISNLVTQHLPGKHNQKEHGGWNKKPAMKPGQPLNMKNRSVKAGYNKAKRLINGGMVKGKQLWGSGAVQLKKDFGIKKKKIKISIGGEMVETKAMVFGDLAAHPTTLDGKGPIVITHLPTGRRIPLVPDGKEPTKVYKALIIANEASDWNFTDPMGKDRAKAQTAVNRLEGAKRAMDTIPNMFGGPLTTAVMPKAKRKPGDSDYDFNKGQDRTGLDKYDQYFTGNNAWRAISEPEKAG